MHSLDRVQIQIVRHSTAELDQHHLSHSHRLELIRHELVIRLVQLQSQMLHEFAGPPQMLQRNIGKVLDFR